MRAPFLQIGIAMLLFLGVIARATAQPNEKEPPQHKKEYAEDFQAALKDTKTPERMKLFGPDVAECVYFELEGLRFNLPKEYPKPRPGTGLVTDFGVKGDFEITARFEILKEPTSGLGSPGPTDLRIIVVPNERPEVDVWFKTTQNRAAIAREAQGRGNIGGFLVNQTRWNPDVPRDKWGNQIFTTIETHEPQPPKRVTAKAKTGQMRLVRTAAKLFFYKRDGNADDFDLLYASEFGTKDLRNVRLLASTGGPNSFFEVRLTDFRIRADAFLKEVAAPPIAAVVPPIIDETPTPPKRTWLIALVISAAMLFTLVMLIGIVFLLRRWRSATAPAKPTPGKAAVRSGDADAILFSCSKCGKRLKSKPERAGKKVRCPHCGTAVPVPADEAEERA